MLVISLLRWWYGAGWRRRAVILNNRLDGTIDYFSVDLLAKTLFSPFRQISAGRVDGPIGIQMRAFADKIISRLIGAFIRTILLILGLITIVVQVALSFAILLFWAVVPALPIVGLVLTILGVTF